MGPIHSTILYAVILMTTIATILQPSAHALTQPDSPMDHCVMGNDTYLIGEHWNPTLPPFGVMFCVHCECLSVERKTINKPEAKIACRNFKDDCPDVGTCPDNSIPTTAPGRCCKSCPGEAVFPFEKSVLRSTARRLLKNLNSRPPPPPIRSEASITGNINIGTSAPNSNSGNNNNNNNIAITSNTTPSTNTAINTHLTPRVSITTLESTGLLGPNGISATQMEQGEQSDSSLANNNIITANHTLFFITFVLHVKS